MTLVNEPKFFLLYRPFPEFSSERSLDFNREI